MPETRKKKPTRKQLIDKADKLFSLAVRARDGYQCVVCGNTTRVMQCAHGFPRSYHQVRWDMRNAWCLCINCHKSYTHHPIQWDLLLHDYWGDALYAEMRANAIAYDVPIDLEAIIAELKAMVPA